MKKFKLVFLFLIALIVILIVVMQFVAVVPNPPITQEIAASEEVKSIFKKSCYDCHSNETKITWLQKLPIVSSMVANDVKKGRKKLNFSQWDSYDSKKQRELLFKAVTEIKEGEMPLSNYLAIHPSAKITEQEIAIVENYLVSLGGFDIDEGQQALYEKAYQSWNPKRDPHFKVSPSMNGIAFPEDYRTWQPIGVSSRIDNGSLRLVVGNDIAIKAISNKQTNPWPDGAVIGKIVWKQRKDLHYEGAIEPGTLVHVEFMFKDTQKYASTYGWGWARWLGMDLVPFGKDAHGASEPCISCHQPIKKGKDWVFTNPAILP